MSTSRADVGGISLLAGSDHLLLVRTFDREAAIFTSSGELAAPPAGLGGPDGWRLGGGEPVMPDGTPAVCADGRLWLCEALEGRDGCHVHGPRAGEVPGNIGALAPTRGGGAPKQFGQTRLACEYQIPPPPMGEDLDFGKVNVVHKPDGQMSEIIPYVGSVDKCDPIVGGWYYDQDPMMGGTPTKIIVCPQTCADFGLGGTVELQLGCKTVIPG